MCCTKCPLAGPGLSLCRSTYVRGGVNLPLTYVGVTKGRGSGKSKGGGKSRGKGRGKGRR